MSHWDSQPPSTDPSRCWLRTPRTACAGRGWAAAGRSPALRSSAARSASHRSAACLRTSPRSRSVRLQYECSHVSNTLSTLARETHNLHVCPSLVMTGSVISSPVIEHSSPSGTGMATGSGGFASPPFSRGVGGTASSITAAVSAVGAAAAARPAPSPIAGVGEIDPSGTSRLDVRA